MYNCVSLIMDIVQYPWYQLDNSLYLWNLRRCIHDFQLKPLIYPLHPIWRYCQINILCNTGILQRYFFENSPKYLIRNDERNTQGGFNDCEMQWCCINYITWEWNQYPGVIYILPFNFFNERWFLVNDLYFLEKKVPLCGWDYYQLLLNKVWCQSILDFSFYLLPLLQV